ncbi:hypothetical protein LTR27_003271 [Elasticomyces elasticus]|nr:hypothetical protein LTR27_003271 [Elasticomyces elasticus]
MPYHKDLHMAFLSEQAGQPLLSMNMDASETQDPYGSETQATRDWQNTANRLAASLLRFEKQMTDKKRLYTDVQARIINRIHTNPLQQVATVTEFETLTQKISKFLSDFDKASSELLVDAEQFADKGTQCTICSFSLNRQPDVASGSAITVRQIDPCGHQFHAACLWEMFDEHKACPECGSEVDADLEVQIGYNGTVDDDSRKGKGEVVGED